MHPAEESQGISPAQDDHRAILSRLRHTTLYRLDGAWGQPYWYTMTEIRNGADGAEPLPGRLLTYTVRTLINSGLVAEGDEVCLDGACMHKVRQYALLPAGHVALAQSFVKATGLWTPEDTAAVLRAAKRVRLT